MPEVEPKTRSRRPGGALDNLARRTIHLRSAEDTNWLPGEAASRLTHNPVYALNPDVLRHVLNLLGRQDAAGVTVEPTDETINKLQTLRIASPITGMLMGPAANYPAGMLQQYGKADQPVSFIARDTINDNPLDRDRENAVLARHEIAHQAMYNLGGTKGWDVDIPERQRGWVEARDKSTIGDDENLANEYGAYLMGDPKEVGYWDKNEGLNAQKKFLTDTVGKADPKLAHRWWKQNPELGPSPWENKPVATSSVADRNLQPPNNVF